MKSSVHAILLGAGKLIIENIKALNQMPPVGATLLIMPFKVKGAKARILQDSVLLHQQTPK